MKELRILKSPCSVIVSLILLCWLLHQFSTSTSKLMADSSKARVLKLQYEIERRTLVQALQRASMSDRTVILTVINRTWARPDSVLDLFLDSFRIGEGTKALLNHLLIVAEDTQAFMFCKSKHPHCFHLKNSHTNFTTTPFKVQGNFMFGRSRLKLLQQVVELGYNVAFTNADVMWLRNPLRALVPNFELSVSCELYPMENETFGVRDGGFFHVKANDVAYEFIKNCDLQRVLFPDSDHQSLCRIIANDNYIELIQMRVQYLDEVNFGRLCQPVDLSQIYTIQANCCENIDSKVHDLKLVLDDWRKYFRELSSNNNASSMRFPKKCRG